MILVFITFEIIQSKNELLMTVDNESKNLIFSLNNSILNNYSANTVIEENIIDKLNSVAAFTEHIYAHHNLNTDNILSEHNIDFLMINDFAKNSLISSDSISNEDISYLNEYYSFMIDEEYKWLELGVIYFEISQQSYYLLGRITSNDNFIVVGILSDKLLNIRKNTGVGTLINDFAKNPGLEYILLQDTFGIFAASETIDNIQPILSDDFLKQAWNDSIPYSRIIDYQNSKIYETVAIINFSDQSKLLTRIAITLETIRNIQQKSLRRTIIFGLIIVLTTGIILILFRTRAKVDVLKNEKDLFEQYFSVLLENINDSVIGTDENNKIILFNYSSEKLFGISKSQLNENDNFLRDILSLISSEHLEEIDTRNILNEKISILAGKSVIRDNTGNVINMYFIKDITEIKSSAELIKRQEKLTAMGQLASGVAHEIRNPLNAINIIAQRLQYEFEFDNQEYISLINTVRHEVARVNRIIQQFLDFARPTKLNKINLNIEETFNHTLNLISSDAKERNIRITSNSDKELYIFADKDKLEQVFLNILRNAIQAIEFDGLISTNIYHQNNFTFIEIKDNGKGISKEHISKIFNPYFSTKNDGTGIGLSIVHQIISEHNGTISVESEPEKGTVFLIKLPDK